MRVYALLVMSMLLWGGTWVAGRIVARTIPPWDAAFLRFLMGSVFLLAMCLASGGVKSLVPKRHHLVPLLLLGITGIFGYSTLFFRGLQTIEAGRAALIVGFSPSCIALASAVFLRERLSLASVGGILLAFAGVAVVMSNGDIGAMLAGGVAIGDLMIVGCVICWTAYTLIGRRVMRDLAPLVVVTWSCVVGTLLLFPLALHSGMLTNMQGWTTSGWVGLVYLGPFATSLAYYWYYDAISRIGSVRSAIFINLVPVFALLLGALLLGETLSASLMIGGGMVMAGVYVTVLWKNRKQKTERRKSI